jgi:cell division control protein 6
MPQPDTLDDIFNKYASAKAVFRNKDTLTDKHIPDKIPHRDEQIGHVARILAPALRGQRISNLFIFGTVGTGKSVSVRHVASELEKKAGGAVRVLYVNCKMKSVADTEYRLLAELSRSMGRRVPSTGLPTDEIYKIFFKAIDDDKKNLILVLDEIDALVKKVGDEILYNMSRANQELENTKLSIVGISNDVSFMDSIDPRVKSSLSEEEVIFPPYNATQLRDILAERAGLAFNDGVIEEGVVAKCAALAAQEHGDARRALDLLRVAGELAERDGKETITADYIDSAEERLDTDRVITVVKSQPNQSKAVLAAVLRRNSESNGGFLETGDIFSEYEKICKNAGLKILTQRRISDLIAELDMLGIINARVISKGRYGRTKEIRIVLSKEMLDRIQKILKDSYILDG